MHESVMAFIRSIPPAVYTGRRVLEVGSCNVNGSARDVIEPHAESYVGVDIVPGKGVDVLCSADKLLGHFPPQSFNCVVSTEMLEHCENWIGAISAMLDVLVVGGYLALTTRSFGFPFHNPPDRWRFETWHIARAFKDHMLLQLQEDPQVPGVFVVVRKMDARRKLDTPGPVSMDTTLQFMPDYPVFAEFAEEAEKIRRGGK